jgi:hypothetical protein
MELARKQLEVGDTTTIDLSGFSSADGQASREFNRVLVCAENGEVTGGTRSTENPKCSVIKLGGGSITATYHTPMSFQFSRDVITTYNSCDVAKQSLQPLATTQPKEVLATDDISIVFPSVAAIVTQKKKEVFHNEKHEARKTEDISYTKETEVTLFFTFAERPRPVYDTDGESFEGKVRKLQYRPVKVVASRHSHKRDGIADNERRNPFGLELATHTVHRETGGEVEVEELDENDVLNLYVHPSTGRVFEVHLPFLDVEFATHSDYDWRRTEMRDDRLVTTEGVRSDDSHLRFSVQPTVDDLDSCDRVSGGDGIHRMSGGCSETTPDEHYTKTQTYRWEVFTK